MAELKRGGGGVLHGEVQGIIVGGGDDVAQAHTLGDVARWANVYSNWGQNCFKPVSRGVLSCMYMRYAILFMVFELRFFKKLRDYFRG